MDDGAGCGIVIEAARLIGQLPRRRADGTRRPLANEEHGLDGGRAYRKDHPASWPGTSPHSKRTAGRALRSDELERGEASVRS